MHVFKHLQLHQGLCTIENSYLKEALRGRCTGTVWNNSGMSTAGDDAFGKDLLSSCFLKLSTASFSSIRSFVTKSSLGIRD